MPCEGKNGQAVVNALIGIGSIAAAYVLSEVWPLPGMMRRAFERATSLSLRRRSHCSCGHSITDHTPPDNDQEDWGDCCDCDCRGGQFAAARGGQPKAIALKPKDENHA